LRACFFWVWGLVPNATWCRNLSAINLASLSFSDGYKYLMYRPSQTLDLPLARTQKLKTALPYSSILLFHHFKAPISDNLSVFVYELLPAFYLRMIITFI